MEIKELDYKLCYDAHRGTSFNPERRAKQEQEGYIKDFEKLLEKLLKINPDKKDDIEIDVLDFESRYRKKATDLLQSKSRIMSTMITGSANFPVARMQKRLDVEHKRLEGCIEYWEIAETRLIRKYTPKRKFNIDSSIVAIESGMYDKALIKGGIERQIVSKAKESFEDAKEMQEFLETEKLKKLFTSRHGIRKKIQNIINNFNTEIEKFEGNDLLVEKDVSENRIRIFFDGKPEEEIRVKLKSKGFRWTPSKGCWQSYNNRHSFDYAMELIR